MNKDVQAILHEIVNILENTEAGLTVLSAHVPMHGYEAKDEMKIAYENKKRSYEELRRKIEALT